MFRDSANWYVHCSSGAINYNVIAFCRSKAQGRLLDLGCATGNYCLELSNAGLVCCGADTNPEYVRIAKARGVAAYLVSDKLPFEDHSFETVIMIEVLEHLADPESCLAEVKRVAKKNVLLTVPDNGAVTELARISLTYEHVLEADHKNYFTKESLAALLRQHFKKCKVTQGDPIYPHRLLPRGVRKPLTCAYRLGFLRPTLFSRLYAECHCE